MYLYGHSLLNWRTSVSSGLSSLDVVRVVPAHRSRESSGASADLNNLGFLSSLDHAVLCTSSAKRLECSYVCDEAEEDDMCVPCNHSFGYCELHSR